MLGYAYSIHTATRAQFSSSVPSSVASELDSSVQAADFVGDSQACEELIQHLAAELAFGTACAAAAPLTSPSSRIIQVCVCGYSQSCSLGDLWHVVAAFAQHNAL